jgi:tyrosyl-tRNA synthetase
MVDNADWLDELNYIPFLRDYRPAFHHQPDADLRLREAAAGARAAADLPRVQLHDPAGLRLRGAVAALRLRLQMGGSDQWGNIVNGIELGRRRWAPKQLFA